MSLVRVCLLIAFLLLWNAYVSNPVLYWYGRENEYRSFSRVEDLEVKFVRDFMWDLEQRLFDSRNGADVEEQKD